MIYLIDLHLQYVFSDKLSFKNGNNCFRKWDHTFTIDEIDTKEIKVPKNKKIRSTFSEMFSYSLNLNKEVQTGIERESRITASDTATAPGFKSI